MRWFVMIIWAICGAATSAAAQERSGDSALTLLQTGDDSRGWEAVGRLDIDGKGFCTGALIAPDLVLTAAHCLYDRATGAIIDPGRIRFQAGLRNGRAMAYRDIRRAVAHPAYSQIGLTASDAGQAGASRYDLALLELTQPIRSTAILPFATDQVTRTGTQVGVVSYALNRSEAPSLQEVCSVLGQQEGVMVLSCDVDYGSSGAPVFRIEDGVARIVSVVSAKAELDSRRVAIGTIIAAPLAELRAELATVGGIVQNAAPYSFRVVTPETRNDTSAKFIRATGD